MDRTASRLANQLEKGEDVTFEEVIFLL